MSSVSGVLLLCLLASFFLVPSNCTGLATTSVARRYRESAASWSSRCANTAAVFRVGEGAGGALCLTLALHMFVRILTHPARSCSMRSVRGATRFLLSLSVSMTSSRQPGAEEHLDGTTQGGRLRGSRRGGSCQPFGPPPTDNIACVAPTAGSGRASIWTAPRTISRKERKQEEGVS